MADIPKPTIEQAMQMASQAQIDAANAVSTVAELRRDFHPELILKQTEKTIHLAMVLSKLINEITPALEKARTALHYLAGHTKPKEDF